VLSEIPRQSLLYGLKPAEIASGRRGNPSKSIALYFFKYGMSRNDHRIAVPAKSACKTAADRIK
jgi:hypothetical protein